jgi:hypothetical protein
MLPYFNRINWSHRSSLVATALSSPFKARVLGPNPAKTYRFWQRLHLIFQDVFSIVAMGQKQNNPLLYPKSLDIDFVLPSVPRTKLRRVGGSWISRIEVA